MNKSGGMAARLMAQLPFSPISIPVSKNNFFISILLYRGFGFGEVCCGSKFFSFDPDGILFAAIERSI
jgi:hypothetical protein